MTIEEAIKNREKCLRYLEQAHKCTVDQESLEAVRMSIAALHAQQTKLDRSRWEGCKSCNGKNSPAVKYGLYYCPICGKPMNEDVWAELERRINGGTTD